MVRTQVQLTEHQAEALHRRALERGTSLAQLIREAVDASLASEGTAEARSRALALAGRFHSGSHDVSRRHDAYLGDDHR